MAYTQSVLEQQLKEGEKFQQGGWPWRLLILSGVTFLTIVAIYGGMQFGLVPYLDVQSKNVDQQINKLGSAISEQEVNNFSSFYSQLNNIQNLLKNHTQGSGFMSFLESSTLRDVYFKSMNVDMGSRVVKIEGNASSYDSLAQQMEVLRQSAEISEINLDGANLSQDRIGGVNFSIRLILK